MYSLLRNFYCIDDFRNDLVGGHVFRLSLIGETDTVTKHLVADRTHILRDSGGFSWWL